MWFVHHYYETKLSDKYIVFDPAGGSGNLVTSWRGHLKHKIVSELQPDLLKTIERRMKNDPDDIQAGFTIIPKTSENKGLNFIDKTANEYLQILENELKEKNLSFDKPLAFLLNPPYKNTDENINIRINANSNYKVDPSIIELTGNDAGNERYTAFLAQILNLSKLYLEKHPGLNPILLIFTATSWLIPRPSYKAFREVFDKHFKYEKGFIVNGNGFFKNIGNFPVSFTIWSYNFNEKGNSNIIKINDYSNVEAKELSINWGLSLEELNKIILKVIKQSKIINFSQNRTSIKIWSKQAMYDFKRDPTKQEIDSKQIYGGLPLKDERRNNKKTYGVTNSNFIGGMEDGTPVRINPRDNIRFSINNINSVWFRIAPCVRIVVA